MRYLIDATILILQKLGSVATIVALTLSAPPAVSAPSQQTITLLKPLTMNGIQGLAFGPDGALYAASLTGRSIYRIDIATGRVSAFVGPPDGAADDLAFSRAGQLVWTGGPPPGGLMARTPAGVIRTIEGMPGLNAVRFSPTGRLYYSRWYGGDALYEADLSGAKPPRLVAGGLGRLNAFDFMPDGSIVGPSYLTGEIIRVDVDTGRVSVIARDFVAASSVRRLGNELLVLSYRTGQIWRMDLRGGARRLTATVDAPADNMVIGPNGRLYVSSTAHNGVSEIDLASGEQRRITWSEMAAPGMLSTAITGGVEEILIADDWGARRYATVGGGMRPLKPAPSPVGLRSVIAWKGGYAFVSIVAPSMVTVVDGSGAATLIEGFTQPIGLAATTAGLVVTDFATGEVVKVDPAAPDARVKLATGLRGPLGVAVAADGAVFVAEYAAGRVSRVDRAGGATPIARGLKRPEGLAIAGNGRLIVADTGAGRLLSIDPATGRRAVLADRLKLGLDLPRPKGAMFLPTGVAVSRDGSAYLPAAATNTLYRITLR